MLKFFIVFYQLKKLQNQKDDKVNAKPYKKKKGIPKADLAIVNNDEAGTSVVKREPKKSSKNVSNLLLYL